MTSTVRRGVGTVAAVLMNVVAIPAFAADITPRAVSFETTCDPAIADDFDRAVTLLHSFEYPETTSLFADILARDPGCAMARWGVAMSIWHPLWAPPTAAELSEGARVLATAADLPMSDREASFINAARTFFSSDDPLTHRERTAAFESGMQALYESHRDDKEVAAFYALALLAAADPTDKTYYQQYKAAAVLNWIRESDPYHPGVLHYLIHSFDYPGLAHLALGAAVIYAEAAPDSAHAQHMPSHIFTRLGLWDRAIASNIDSTASATEFTKRAGLHGHYDEGLHSIDYLMYALLQVGRDADAKSLLDRLSKIDKPHIDSFKAAYTYAASPARYAIERRDWLAASRLQLTPPEFPWDEFPWAVSIHRFARALGAVRSGQVEAARRELDTIIGIRNGLDARTLPYWREEVSVHADAISAWISMADGNPVEARRLAADAADREDAVDKHPVTPGEIIPARELYADLLSELGDHAAALAQYRQVLATSPARLNGLAGAARSASIVGEHEAAREYYGRLVEQAGNTDSVRPAIKAAREYLETGVSAY